jgi:hypothetical protein
VYVLGNTASKTQKINKDHNKQKMFRIGISVGRNYLNVEGHLQAGYSSKTIKNYKPVENTLTKNKPLENTLSKDEPDDSIQNVEE